MDRHTPGFSLIELIVVILIVGIIAGSAAVAIRTPVSSYFATVRRSELSDEADNALRFVDRELKSALPNSIRCDTGGTPRRLEFIPIRSGGRYREYPRSDGSGTPLRFGTEIGSFGLMGTVAADSMSLTTATGDTTSGAVVIGNLSSNSGTPCNAYARDNLSPLTAISDVGEPLVEIQAQTIPDACNLAMATIQDNTDTTRNEENNRGIGRFFVVGSPVEYTCGPGGLLRYTGYSADSASVTMAPGVTPATLAGRVSACELACENVNARVQTISFLLTLTEGGESIELFRQARVENLP